MGDAQRDDNDLAEGDFEFLELGEIERVAVDVGLAYHASTLLLSSMLFLTLAGSAFSAVTQVVGHLQVHPEFRRRFEKRSQADRRIPCDPSFIL